MRRFLAIFTLVLVAVTFGARPSLALTYETPCYCRYSSSHADFTPAKNTNAATAQLYCPNEVYYWGMVSATAGDTSTIQALATAACGTKCASDGTTFVAIKSDKLAWANYPQGNDEYVNMEDQQCVFTAFDLADKPPHWEAGYVGCKEPLNSILSKPWPEACSFCFCKFKAGGSTPAECVGKFTMVHATSNKNECPSLCTRLGLDQAGPGVESYSDSCDFTTSDKCANPRNVKGEGCKKQQDIAAEAKKNVLSSGSVVTLPLPLANATLPTVISRVIATVMGIVGAVALLMFVWGGAQWMMAAGSQEKVAKAKKTIVWATLGLLAIFSSYAILNFVINALT